MHEAKEPEKAGKVKCRAKKVGSRLNYNNIQARVMVGTKVPQTAYVICIIKHLPGGLLRSNTRVVCMLVVGNLKCHSLCTVGLILTPTLSRPKSGTTSIIEQNKRDGEGNYRM